MTQTEQVLHTIIQEIQTKTQNGAKVKAVFDLDSTLFDVRPRLLNILHEFAQTPEMLKKYPSATQKISQVQELTHSYHIKDHMYEFGLENEPQEFFKEVFHFWRTRFFSNDYLIHDQPELGAVEFVNYLHTLGVHIVYLTGRDIPRMQKGTIESLKQCNFPVEKPLVDLILKPHFNMDDAEFKRDHFNNIEKENIWFFENEPVNIQLILKDCPHVNCIFFDSVHMGEAEEPRHLPTIKNFKMDLSLFKK